MYNTRKKNTNGVRCYCAIFGFDVGHYTVGTSHDFHILHNILVPFFFFSFFFLVGQSNTGGNSVRKKNATIFPL